MEKEMMDEQLVAIPQEEEFATLLREKYKDRHICIAWPSPELADYRFHHSLLQFIIQNGMYVRIGITNPVSSRVAVNRNIIVEEARKQGATDIMWLDADSVFPINGLLRLLNHDKDIACATTCRRKGNDRRAIATVDEGYVALPGRKLDSLKLVGFPFMLTKMSVFDKLDEYFKGIVPQDSYSKLGEKPPYFAEPPRWMVPDVDTSNDKLIGEDEYFCHFARKAGMEIFCDPALSMEIGHVGSTVFYIDPNQGVQEAKVDMKLGELETAKVLCEESLEKTYKPELAED